ncbi:MAG: hypothetical protein BZY79_04975 [SAR202 cluster bacterium Casp-Chloro-G4]|nr:hypothetical protein [Chloroflexota bacterium]MDA1226384.1 hypothetical protein [Chloroflexota bacterium]PKB61233.1 MAG: hypothetical protein BZY79_04975 [SAR202 cluster bacterium Casp-Chloro-G4]
MSDSIEQAKAAFHRWNAAFNARDTDAMVAEMHFPHRRLNGQNQFEVWENTDDFRATRGENMTASLNAQGWDHTATTSIEAVQSGPDKVHLAINQSRRRADGTEYNAFPTLWIFTKIEGRWGVQFRSSFLSEPVQPSGDVLG